MKLSELLHCPAFDFMSNDGITDLTGYQWINGPKTAETSIYGQYIIGHLIAARDSLEEDEDMVEVKDYYFKVPEDHGIQVALDQVKELFPSHPELNTGSFYPKKIPASVL